MQETVPVDLGNCDREPIHLLGAIQPFGFLVALSADWIVRRASANLTEFLGLTAEAALGLSATDLFGEDAVHLLRNRMTLLRGADAVERVFGVATKAGRFDFAMHVSGSDIVVEGEPSDDMGVGDTASTIRAMIGRLDATDNLAAFFREGARQVRALTGFDRVMVYRFDNDGSGTVVAEAVRGGIGSFMDLRYPASDIPKQARALYLRTPFRIIADIAAEPSPVLPQLDERGEALDLSLSVLRSVSPIHVEYLSNMGVGASLSISIIVEGKLWGLFACHHYGARRPGFERRSIAELFGQMFAFKLESRERKTMAAYEIAARAASDRLLAAIAGNKELLDNPDYLGEMLRTTIACDGIAIWLDGRVALSGRTPPAEAIPVIARRLNAMTPGHIFATDHLASVLPQAERWADLGAGLLALPLSRTPRDYVMLFREERVRAVTWGGDPHKPATWGPNGARLSPRKSFEAWREEVRGRSEPFNEAEMRVAEMLRASLIEVVLRLSDDAQEERRRANERQELLIAELNHRVRNILSLIRGLVRQSRDPAADADTYMRMLEGRVESLARAHDQITQDNWSPAPLKRLIETEAAAYLGGRANRLSTSGEAALLSPQAFSTLALVLHELMTNSAKYGALSDSGTVSVDWHVDTMGDLCIEWRERGGPAVQAPTRQGFGTTIIQRSVPYDLGGRAAIRYALAGLEADFVIPARHVSLGREADAVQLAAPVADPRDTASPREASTIAGVALLVEDSLIIAMDAEDILISLGAERVVTANGVAQAMAEIDREPIAVAVLDFNLGSETSLPVALELAKRGIPFVFATGYGEQLVLPAELDDRGVLKKPYTALGMRRVLGDAMGSPGE
ncbi:HWE histidine kinase domain-containing protein [Sphingomonas yantingensis]|uniref:histidine kinase n=1 Tax=Sphingomonas yantingensis TaxID=1241761 RepID=A0A7W9AQD5_9SPHN|nr:HWE histidine kinase domain-containing protein [Sphingomonas yantingensis]MBB5698434.1 light-regulated signal transduction histidine kinase (bacteriophytochrome)/CheY-like chemotaxis protein [Sphingomonas yantingensis]